MFESDGYIAYRFTKSSSKSRAILSATSKNRTATASFNGVLTGGFVGSQSVNLQRLTFLQERCLRQQRWQAANTYIQQGNYQGSSPIEDGSNSKTFNNGLRWDMNILHSLAISSLATVYQQRTIDNNKGKMDMKGHNIGEMSFFDLPTRLYKLLETSIIQGCSVIQNMTWSNLELSTKLHLSMTQKENGLVIVFWAFHSPQ